MNSSYLYRVKRPARYLGKEINAARMPRLGDLRVGLSFPELYEVGMSNLGLGILYHLLNSIPGLFAERVFAPDVDLEGILREQKVPLMTLETHTPLKDLDILGFSLQYELTYTNVLTILDLGGIPLHSSERARRDPLVLGGGPCAFNPEPLSEFIDAFVIGDGEQTLPDICLLYREWKASGSTREELLRALDTIEGIYIPSYFSLQPSAQGGKEHLVPLGRRRGPVRKATVRDLESAPFPERPIVPSLKIIHDRLNIEVARGCPHGCRFCQAGVIYRPFRERSPERIFETTMCSLDTTGYEEVSLLSLSIGDYSALPALVERLMGRLSRRRIALSLPSIRVGSLDPKVVNEILRVRKTGFTLAPEAASRRLQDVINKRIDQEELLKVTHDLASAGWRAVKLYFMIGLPRETEQDVEEIIKMVRYIQRAAGRGGDGFQITVNVSTFVPKAHTPFQWICQISRKEAERTQAFLREQLWRSHSFRLKWHDSRLSLLEGVFARGDRRLGRLLEKAYRLGCRLDGWSEYLRFDLWEAAFDDTGIDPDQYLGGVRSLDEPLPWDWIDCGVKREFLVQEHQKAMQGVPSLVTCRGACDECGMCTSGGAVKRTNDPWESTLHIDESLHTGSIAPISGQQRIRFRYSKQPPAVFLGHLETMAVLQRAFRRSCLPVAYTMGQHPHLRMSLSQALALGTGSVCEFLDAWFEGDVDPRRAVDLLNSTLPEGFEVTDAYPVLLKAPSLEEDIKEVRYRILFPEGVQHSRLREALPQRVQDFRSGAISIVQITKGQRVTFLDLRTYVKELTVSDESMPVLLMTLCRWNGSFMSISRVLEALMPPGSTDAWQYRVQKVDTRFGSSQGNMRMD